MQDIHQCGYGTRPVQVPSPLLPKEKSGDLSLDLGTHLESTLLQNSKMAPLIKIFTSLLPYPPFLHPIGERQRQADLCEVDASLVYR